MPDREDLIFSLHYGYGFKSDYVLTDDDVKVGIYRDVYKRQVLSDYTLNEISQNMQNIDSDWSNALEDYQVDIYNERDEVVGKLDLTHYASTYYMSNDLELLNTVNQVILIIGIVSVGSIVVVSAMISKSISIPIVKVSRMAKLIETGQYKKEVETRSDIKEIRCV